MNQIKFVSCATIDTQESIGGEYALPIRSEHRGDKKLRKALYMRDPAHGFLIRKKRSLTVISLNNLFVDAKTRAPTTEEIYDRALLSGLKKPPSYSGVFMLTQNPDWLRRSKLYSCLIGTEPFTGTDGHKYIPEMSDLLPITGEDALCLRARRATSDVRWSPDELWLFELTT